MLWHRGNPNYFFSNLVNLLISIRILDLNPFSCTTSLKLGATLANMESSSKNTEAEVTMEEYEIRRQKNRRSATRSRHRQREKIKRLEQEVTQLEEEGFELSRARINLVNECADLKRTLATLNHGLACRLSQNKTRMPNQQVPDITVSLVSPITVIGSKNKSRNTPTPSTFQISSSVTRFGTSSRVFSTSRPAEKTRNNISTAVRLLENIQSGIPTNIRPDDKTRHDAPKVDNIRHDAPNVRTHLKPSLSTQENPDISSIAEPHSYSILIPPDQSTRKHSVASTLTASSIKVHPMAPRIVGCVQPTISDGSLITSRKTLDLDPIRLSICAAEDNDKAMEYDRVSNPLGLSCNKNVQENVRLNKSQQTLIALECLQSIYNIDDCSNEKGNGIADPTKPSDSSFPSDNLSGVLNLPQSFGTKETRFSSTVSVLSIENLICAKFEDNDGGKCTSDSKDTFQSRRTDSMDTALSMPNIDIECDSGAISLTSSTISKQGRLSATTHRSMASFDHLRPFSTSTRTLPYTDYFTDVPKTFECNNDAKVPTAMDISQYKQSKGAQTATPCSLKNGEHRLVDLAPDRATMVQPGHLTATDGMSQQTQYGDSRIGCRGVQVNSASQELPQNILDFVLNQPSRTTAPVMSSVEEALALLMDNTEPFRPDLK